jgi:hypothetical protein
VLKNLLNSSFDSTDLLVERSEIESEYVKLLAAGGAPGSNK